MCGLNSGTTEHVETRITLIHEHINQVFSDPPFGKEHLEDLVPVEDPAFWRGRSSKTTFNANLMQMRMPSREIAKRN